MDNQNAQKKIILSYGLILGIASVIVTVINYSFGNIFKPHWSVSLISTLLFIGLIVYGIKAFKTENQGFLKLGQAIKVAVGIALIAGILSALYQYILTSFIEPDYFSDKLAFVEETLLEKFPDMDEALIEQQIEMQEKFSSPISESLVVLAMSMLGGLLVGLISGLIMKKEDNPF